MGKKMAQPEYQNISDGTGSLHFDISGPVQLRNPDMDFKLKRSVYNVLRDFHRAWNLARDLQYAKASGSEDLHHKGFESMVITLRPRRRNRRVRRRRRKNRAARKKRQAKIRKQALKAGRQEGRWLSKRTREKMQKNRRMVTVLRRQKKFRGKDVWSSGKMQRAACKGNPGPEDGRGCLHNGRRLLRKYQRTTRRFKLPLVGSDKIALARGLRPSFHFVIISLTCTRSHLQASVKVVEQPLKKAKTWTLKIFKLRWEKALAMLKSIIGQKSRLLDNQTEKNGQLSKSKQVERTRPRRKPRSIKDREHAADKGGDGEGCSEDDGDLAVTRSTEEVSCNATFRSEDCRHFDQSCCNDGSASGASLFARHETGFPNVVFDPSDDKENDEDGNTGYVGSMVERTGQNPVDDPFECGGPQQESDDNYSDMLYGTSEDAVTDSVNNNEDASDCPDENKRRPIVSDTEAAEKATGKSPHPDEKMIRTNMAKPRLTSSGSPVSPSEVLETLSTLKDKDNQPSQAEESIVADKEKADCMQGERKCELTQLYSVEQFPSVFREIRVFMFRAEHRKANHTLPPVVVPEGFSEEIRRLATFYDYTASDDIFVIPLAKTGFYLTSNPEDRGSRDAEVVCAFCAVVVPIHRFRGRNAEEVHREVSPRCRFLLGENVGNVSIAEIAERAGTVFIDKYSVNAGGAIGGASTPSRSFPSLPPAASPLRRDPLAEVLATDSEPHAAEEHARYALPIPTVKPGSSFSSLPAVIGNAQVLGNGESGRRRDTAVQQQQQQQQLQRDGTRGSGLGETVADSRLTSHAGQGGAQQPATTSAAVPGAGRTEMPYQTAMLTTPRPQLSGVEETATSQTSAEHQPASNQTSVSQQTARMTAGPVTAGGTAREALANTAPVPEDQEGSQNTGGVGHGTDQTGPGTERQLVTYEELGIFSQRPKRPDMAVNRVRINTFTGWPHTVSHPIDAMAEAGFYYTGHADLVRCFHCKGGLKTWERTDQPWIEHARWFQKCPYVKLCKGVKFVQAVQKLNNPDTKPRITEADVTREIRRMEDEERRNLSSNVVMLENLPNHNALSDPALARAGLRVDADVTEANMQEMAERLVEENEELASSTLCKMCQTNEVNVLFLPCGHLVACAQCAPALRTCAMCRQPVKGSVRVLLDEKRESEELNEHHADNAAAGGNSAGMA